MSETRNQPAADRLEARLEFRNLLCILHSIDADELQGVSQTAARSFVTHPVQSFMRADDAMAAAIWNVVEARRAPVVQVAA